MGAAESEEPGGKPSEKNELGIAQGFQSVSGGGEYSRSDHVRDDQKGERPKTESLFVGARH